jgi:sugar lactone lactonase YvrE
MLMSARRLVVVGLAVFGMCSGAFLCAGTPAFAAEVFGFIGEFGGAATSPADPEPLSDPAGIAVDENAASPEAGDVYVVDAGNDRVERFSASGAYLSQFNGSVGPPTGVFSGPGAIAVDNSKDPLDPSAGDVYVADTGHDVIDKFTAAGSYVGQLTGFDSLDGVAVDPSGDLWVNAGAGLVERFNDALANESVSHWSTGRSESPGIAVDGHENVYVRQENGALARFDESGGNQVFVGDEAAQAPAVDDATNGLVVAEEEAELDPGQGTLVAEYGPFGEPAYAPIRQFGAEAAIAAPGAVAVESASGRIYVVDPVKSKVDVFGVGPELPRPSTGAASEVKLASAMVSGTVDPNGLRVTSCRFEYGTSSSYGQSVPCAQTSTEIGEGQTPVAVSAELTGLQLNTAYHFRLSVASASGPAYVGLGETLTTAGAPTVGVESFSGVGTLGVTLHAQVDPQGLPTSYYFEYGTTDAYGSRTPVETLEATHAAVAVQAQLLSGLQAGTEYHYRVIAESEGGKEAGTDATFRTFPFGTLGLPDGRVFERVSPAEDGQAEIYTPQVFGLGLPRSEGIDEEFHAGGTANMFAVSTGGDAVVYPGAATTGGKSEANDYLATRSPAGGWRQVNIEPAGRFGGGYFAFSSDLSVGILRVSSEHAGVEDGLPPLSPEAPGDGYTIFYKHDLESKSYEPFITRADSLHREPEGPSALYSIFEGASADFSQVFFGVNDALTANAVEIAHNEYDQYYADNLYESAAGQLSLVNVLPDGSSEPNAVFGAPCIAQHGNNRFCFSPPIQTGPQEEGAESADLSRAISANGSRVFWTDLETGNLYVREDPAASDAKTVQVNAGVGGAARFWTASVDGSKVFFTKGERALIGQKDGELYEYALETGQTTDLTPGVEVAGVIGASEDGEYLYYVDRDDNLNLWHDGTSTFIATLSEGDGGETETVSPYVDPAGDWYTSLGHRTAEVTPDGHGLVFMSNQSLKAEGYPNGAPNGGLDEVYAYEAEDGGRLFCVSCSSSGETPAVTAYGAAAFVPVSWQHTEQLKWISDDGSRVFFDSAEPLVPQDTNGKLDVYEWERDGSGSCDESMGCVYLLSGGQSGSSSWLLGASASGDDVFVISRAPLVAGDPYDGFAVYDARVGGVQALTPPACTGTGCQGVPPAPPIFATPASVTFNGVGNFPPSSGTVGSGGKVQSKPKGKARSLTRAQRLAGALKACRKKRGRARSVCRTRARKRYAAKRTGKSSMRKGN